MGFHGAKMIALCSFEYFINQGRGQLVCVSSVAGVRGIPEFPAYSASKAFVSNYLEALSIKAAKLKSAVVVTDLCAGYISTPLLKNVTGGAQPFLVSPVEQAVAKMVTAIQKKRGFVYVPGYWRFVAWLFKVLPERVLALLPG